MMMMMMMMMMLMTMILLFCAETMIGRILFLGQYVSRTLGDVKCSVQTFPISYEKLEYKIIFSLRIITNSTKVLDSDSYHYVLYSANLN